MAKDARPTWAWRRNIAALERDARKQQKRGRRQQQSAEEMIYPPAPRNTYAGRDAAMGAAAELDNSTRANINGNIQQGYRERQFEEDATNRVERVLKQRVFGSYRQPLLQAADSNVR